MAVAANDTAAAAAIVADLERLLASGARQNQRSLLEDELRRWRPLAEAPPPAAPQPATAPSKRLPAVAPPTPIAVAKVAPPAGPSFSTITRYAWDQSKKFVKVYLTLKGVEAVPDDQLRFSVTEPDTLRLEVLGLPPPAANQRLLVAPLCHAVLAEGCSCVRKVRRRPPSRPPGGATALEWRPEWRPGPALAGGLDVAAQAEEGGGGCGVGVARQFQCAEGARAGGEAGAKQGQVDAGERALPARLSGYCAGRARRPSHRPLARPAILRRVRRGTV